MIEYETQTIMEVEKDCQKKIKRIVLKVRYIEEVKKQIKGTTYDVTRYLLVKK